MRKITLPFIAIAIIMLVAACNSENDMLESSVDAKADSETQQLGRTLSLTASMPGEPTTYVGLEKKEDNSIELTWEANDQLELAFVQEGVTTVQKTVTVKNISADKKKADFDLTLPEGFDATKSFDVYGVLGGGGLSKYSETLTHAMLPTPPSSTSSLVNVQNNKDVMLYFTATIASEDENISVMFKHLGSLFNINITNKSGATLSGITELRLNGNGASTNWAYNNTGGKSFDLSTEQFQDIGSGGNYIFFLAEGTDILDGETVSLWAWYPMAGSIWPKLELQAITAGDIVTSINSHPERTEATLAGKSFYFEAEWTVGGQLKFSNISSVITNDPGTDIGSLGTIGFVYQGDNVTYTTVRAADGNIWLQQNLGAKRVGTKKDDRESFGDLYAWGRWSDGHESRAKEWSELIDPSVASPNNPSGLNKEGENPFYFHTPFSNYWWIGGADTDLWDKSTPAEVTATNGCDPCKQLLGNEWKVPSLEDWQHAFDKEDIDFTIRDSAYDSNLKITLGGYRDAGSGKVSQLFSAARLWTSTSGEKGNAHLVSLKWGQISFENFSRGGGLSIRCIKK